MTTEEIKEMADAIDKEVILIDDAVGDIRYCLDRIEEINEKLRKALEAE